MKGWVETPYGKRYKEEYGTLVAFFMTAPDENNHRILSDDVIKIILKEYMNLDQERREE